MRFVRIYTRKDTGEIVAVNERETPFTERHVPVTMRGPDGKPPFEIEEHEMVAEDFEPGMAEYGPDRVLAQMSASRHLFDGLMHRGDGKFEGKPGVVVPALIDFPASLGKIKDALRAGGPRAMPVKIRAWLANILPPEQVAELGIGRAIPMSALKAAEKLRNKRDPHGGSRLGHLEMIAQRQSDAHAAARLRKRRSQERVSDANP